MVTVTSPDTDATARACGLHPSRDETYYAAPLIYLADSYQQVPTDRLRSQFLDPIDHRY